MRYHKGGEESTSNGSPGQILLMIIAGKSSRRCLESRTRRCKSEGHAFVSPMGVLGHVKDK